MLNRFASVALVTFALFAAASPIACATHYIPNTDVEDTTENRHIISFCEQYRKAVEHRDVYKILKMVSPKYFEDGGNVDASDDLDREGLVKFLKTRFKEAKAIRYEIRYRKVSHNESADRYYVDYTFSASFKIPGPDKKDVWKRVVDDNRLELVKNGDSYLITAGM